VTDLRFGQYWLHKWFHDFYFQAAPTQRYIWLAWQGSGAALLRPAWPPRLKAGRISSGVGVAANVVMFAGLFVAQDAIRRLDATINGRRIRPWPFGYASLHTQIKATMP